MRGPGAWSPVALFFASTTTLTLMAQLYFRSIFVFRRWPWPLAILPSGEASSLDEKKKVASNLCVCRPECFDEGLTEHIRKRNTEAPDVLNDLVGLGVVNSTLHGCPFDNIANEDRFARHQNYSHCDRGHACNAATAASRHVLAESSLWHAVSIDECL